MTCDSVHSVAFSPTGTTRKIVESIAQGIHAGKMECMDLTLPGAHPYTTQIRQDSLAIFGCPVYAGRLPSVAVNRLRTIRADGDTPAAIVVVYGNRAYDDALLELRDVVQEMGFRPVAAGAFIGEHSYSTQANPIAADRPDADDIQKAVEFGGMIRIALSGTGFACGTGALRIPGNFPYRELRVLQGISPVAQEPLCTRCGACVKVCPVAAISSEHPSSTNANACIRCCACIRTCPARARVMADARIRNVAEQLSSSCGIRKEPEIYL